MVNVTEIPYKKIEEMLASYSKFKCPVDDINNLNTASQILITNLVALYEMGVNGGIFGEAQVQAFGSLVPVLRTKTIYSCYLVGMTLWPDNVDLIVSSLLSACGPIMLLTSDIMASLVSNRIITDRKAMHLAETFGDAIGGVSKSSYVIGVARNCALKGIRFDFMNESSKMYRPTLTVFRNVMTNIVKKRI